MSARVTTISWGLAALALGACSAIVQPDSTRLGGIDAGVTAPDTSVGPTDAGPRPDSAVDAFAPSTPDAGPVCPASCDDGLACTRDACRAGRCVHEPDDDECPGGRCSVMLGCVSTMCASDEECEDGDRCNGAERCVPGAGTENGCVDGVAPDCNDGVSCTDDDCDPSRGCVHERFDDRCDDGIDCTTDVCAGTAGPSGCEFRPDDDACAGTCTMGARCTNMGCVGGMPRTCPSDGSPCTVEGCDESAGGCFSEPLDADGDGHPAATVSASGTIISCRGGTDCNDGNAAVSPDAMETCGNGLDDDCDPATSDTCPGATGDTCATARRIELRDGTGSATVTFSGVRDDYATHCGGGEGRDHVFYFDVTTSSDVEIETTGSVDTILASATSCSEDAFFYRCNDDRDPGSNTNSRIWLRPISVPPGGSVRVYVLLEEYAMDADSATVTVTLSPVSPNTCPSGSSARPLDISGGGVVFGSLGIGTGAGGVRGSCQAAASGSEAMFRIEEPDRSLNRLEAVAPGFVPDLYVRYGGCSGGSELSCVRGASSPGGGGSATQDAITGMSASQLFYVFLDNFPVTGGSYELRYDP